MARYRCNSCGGEYNDILEDGSLYFHACPPVTDPITGETKEHPNKRDENISQDPETGEVKIRSVGKGRRKIQG